MWEGFNSDNTGRTHTENFFKAYLSGRGHIIKNR